MTEEVKKVETKVEVPENVEQLSNDTPEYTEVELEAMKMGWRPKEDFDGDAEHEFVDAAEFIKRKPLFDKMASLKKELKDQSRALRELQAHHARVREAERKSILEDLRAEKKKALEEGDADKLISIDEQITDFKASQVAEKVSAPQRQSVDPRFVAWVEKNSWYAQDEEMRVTADSIGTQYAARNPETHPDDVLKHVERQIKRIYADKFQNPARSRPSSVEGTSRPASGKQSKAEDFELTEDERRVMNTFVRSGVMTKEAYIAELKKIKGQA